MHNKLNSYSLLILLLSLPYGVTAQSVPSTTSWPVQLDNAKILCVPMKIQFAFERVSDTFWVTWRNNPQGIYLATDETEELYLMDQISKRQLLHVHMPGKFIELVEVQTDKNGLLMQAMIQSAGADDAHLVALRLSPDADGWQATSALDSPEGKKRSKTDKWTRAGSARSADDFARSVFKGRAIPSGVDFTTQRVAAVRVMLTSGSNRIVKIRVHETDEAYYVSYEIKRPRIGTTDIRWTTPFAVLPANGKKVLFAERGKRGVKYIPGAPVATQTGVLRKKPNPA